MSNQQLFLQETARCIKTLRDFLRVQNFDPQQLTAAIHSVGSFKRAASGDEVKTFRLIGNCLENVLLRHSITQTILSKIELETADLAIDWLSQLLILYEENQPEPKSLLSELFYAFALVEHSQDAVNLSELVADHVELDSVPRVDPFLEDPVFDVEECSVPSRHDPFAGDPSLVDESNDQS